MELRGRVTAASTFGDPLVRDKTNRHVSLWVKPAQMRNSGEAANMIISMHIKMRFHGLAPFYTSTRSSSKLEHFISATNLPLYRYLLS